MPKVEDLLSWVVPDAERCRQEAISLINAHPGETPDQLAARAIEKAKKLGAAAGGATGAFANPLVMIPAAFADMSAILKIEGTMAGTIAALLDPISVNNPPTFQADILSIVFPGAISQALRQLGVRAGQHVTRSLIRKYLTRNLVESGSKFAAKYLALHLTEKAVITKTVPLVGAGIGAGWNYLEIGAVGNRAVAYYQDKTLAPRTGRQRFQRVRSLMRALPIRRKKPQSDDTPG